MKKTVTEHRQEVEQRLAKIETIVETHVENIYHHVKRIEKLVELQNGRVRKNEEQIARWKGVVSVVAFLCAGIITLLSILLGA
jgi:2-methylcitrate dehydratase PrpD